MVYAGEEPRFILRRLLILASEDIGMAAPHMISVVESCAAAFDRVGMPEGRYHMAHATLALATAPKSNSVMGFFDALAAIEREQEGDVPNHLKDPGRDKKGFGHGQGYLYPHAYRDHWVEQQYLPSSLQGRVFYRPSAQGYEAALKEEVDRRREAQLTAMVEHDRPLAPPEILTWSPSDPSVQRWLQRTMGTAGQRLSVIRDRVFELAQIERHHVVVDLRAATGLLTWEALRQAPEGHVLACVQSEVDAQALAEQSQPFEALHRPHIIHASIVALPDRLASMTLEPERVVGRNVLSTAGPDRDHIARALVALLQPKARLVLVESIPRRTQRIHALVEHCEHEPDWMSRWIEAEESMYQRGDDPVLGWDVETLVDALERAGMVVVSRLEQLSTRVQLTPEYIERWFIPTSNRPTYASRLTKHLGASELEELRGLLHKRLAHQTVDWESSVVLLEGTLPA